MKALVASRDLGVTRFLRLILREERFQVDVAATAAEAAHLLAQVIYDFVVLEVAAFDWGTLRQVQAVRDARLFPMVLLAETSTHASELAKSRLANPDEVLVTPVSSADLLRRIRALYSRVDSKLEVGRGHIEINRLLKVVTVDGTRLDLTEREYATIDYLARFPGRLVTRWELTVNVCGPGVQTKAVEVYIHRLRRKLGRHAHLVITGRARGYRLEK